MLRLSQPKPTDPREVIVSVRVTQGNDPLAVIFIDCLHCSHSKANDRKVEYPQTDKIQQNIEENGRMLSMNTQNNRKAKI